MFLTTVLLAVLAAGGACAPARHTSTAVGRLAPPATAAPATPPPAVDGSGATKILPIALPVPVGIPEDPYAPEPVVEIGTIEIPAIGLTHRIYQGVTLNNIDRGPSLWTGSAMPGQMGNTVFAGHRTTLDEPFRHIDQLVAGDKVIFTIAGVTTTYLVTGHLIVQPSDTWIADQTAAYTGTLYACHPLGSAAERYVVQLKMQQ